MDTTTPPPYQNQSQTTETPQGVHSGIPALWAWLVILIAATFLGLLSYTAYTEDFTSLGVPLGNVRTRHDQGAIELDNDIQAIEVDSLGSEATLIQREINQ